MLQYMRERDMPAAFLEECDAFLRNRFKNRSAFDEEELLITVPNHVSHAVLYHRNLKDIRGIRLFQGMTNISQVVFLFKKLVPCFFSKDKLLAREGHPVRGVVLISSGIAEILRRRPGRRSLCPPRPRPRGSQSSAASRSFIRLSEFYAKHLSRSRGAVGEGEGVFVAETDEETRSQDDEDDEAFCQARDVVELRSHGDIIGHEALESGTNKYHYSVRTATNVRGYFLGQLAINEVCEFHPEMGFILQGCLARAIAASEFASSWEVYNRAQFEVNYILRRSVGSSSAGGGVHPLSFDNYTEVVVKLMRILQSRLHESADTISASRPRSASEPPGKCVNPSLSHIHQKAHKIVRLNRRYSF